MPDATATIANQVHSSVELATPSGNTRTIDFTVDQGTNMSVDISPNSKWIIFDLLGHIYRVPTEGGDAECLTQDSGPALNFHPRYSPDGEHIAFISDRGGAENLWIMRANGETLHNVNPDGDASYQQPAWAPDGKTIYVRRSEQVGFVSNSKIWAYPASGGQGEVIRKRREAGLPQPYVPRDIEFYAPSPSPDGATLYYTANFPVTDPLDAPDAANLYIQKLDLESGTITFLREQDNFAPDPEEGTVFGAEVPGSEESLGMVKRTPYGEGDFQAQISPDGRYIAYVRPVSGSGYNYRGHQYGPRNALFVHDFETGTERLIVEQMPIDLARTFALNWYGQPIIPHYAWAKDGGSIVFSEGGRIRRVDVKTGEIKTVPFKARVHRVLSEQVRGKIDIDDEAFPVHFMRWPSSSPDGLKLVFEAGGDLWVMDFADGVPQKLVANLDNALQKTPSWSPDGKWIAFATWDDGKKTGAVWKVSASGGDATPLAEEPGEYAYPVWSPDGTSIAVTGKDASVESEIGEVKSLRRDPWRIFTLPDSGGRLSRGDVILEGRRPQFDADGNLFAEVEAGLLARICSNGTTGRSAVSLKPASNTEYGMNLLDSAMPSLSPDRQRVAYVLEEKVYVAFLGVDAPVEVLVNGTQLSSQCIASKPGEQCLTSLHGGMYPRWKDATTVEYMNGWTHVVYDALTGKVTKTPIELNIRRSVVKGRIALTGAKLVTFNGDNIVESGDIIVEGRRIVCVGTCDTSDADRVIDVRGKVIAPGLIDTHGHHGHNRAAQPVTLAYGVTTTTEVFDENGNASVMGQLLDNGKVLGPRYFTTGSAPHDVHEEAQAVHTLDEARAVVNRRLHWGASYIKIYQFASRWKRQLLNNAARERGITVTGGHDGLYRFVGYAIDGMPGWEHKIAESPVYRDVTEFMGRAKMNNSFTSVSSGHARASRHYYRSRHDLLTDEKYGRFVPRFDIRRAMNQSALVNEGAVPEKSEFSFPMIAAGEADIVRAGGYVTIGEHGEQAGIGDHWEIWDLAEAMTPLEALRAATLHGARWLGIDHETGSLEVGKLADMVVFNSDPLEDIHNSSDLAYVMKAGVLYHAETLDEIWPEERPCSTTP